MDPNQIQADLVKINQEIQTQEARRGTLPDDQLAAILAPLHQKQAALTAQLAQASGSGAVAQGGGSKAVGARGVLVEGDVGGSIITGSQNRVGGIQAKTIQADNVVVGMQQVGGDLSHAADAVALAQALSSGRIRADSIEAQNVVAGFQYIADPAQATPAELRQEIKQLQQQVADALAAGHITANADVADAQEALDKAETELAQPQPQGSRVVRQLKQVSDIFTEGAKTAEAAQKVGSALIKLAPVAAALYQIAARLFGG